MARISQIVESALSTKSMILLAPEASGIGVPSYKRRESEFPPTSVGNRSSLLQEILGK